MNRDYGDNDKKSSGIYRITNVVNGRFYIGFTRCFQLRWNKHSSDLKRNKHPNTFLQNDYNVCGDDAFSFSVLEVVEATIDNDSRVLLEQQYLDLYYDRKVQCYNIQNKAAPEPSTYSHNPEITRKKNSRPMPQHTKEALRKANLGRKLSEEHLQKLREAKAGRKLSPEHREKAIKNLVRKHLLVSLSEETKRKISLAKLGKKHSQETKDKIGESNRKRWTERKKSAN